MLANSVSCGNWVAVEEEARTPALAAFEAKEMFSSIERTTAPVDLPDWQDLHADVEVQ